MIDLGAAPLDGEADWYTLTSHEESLQILVSRSTASSITAIQLRQNNKKVSDQSLTRPSPRVLKTFWTITLRHFIINFCFLLNDCFQFIYLFICLFFLRFPQRRAGLQMSESATSPVGSVDHLSPPSTSSRLSDSEPDPSDLGDGEEGGGGGGVGGGGSAGMGGPLLPPSRHTRAALERSVRSDGASVSSMGSSSRYTVAVYTHYLHATSSTLFRWLPCPYD